MPSLILILAAFSCAVLLHGADKKPLTKSQTIPEVPSALMPGSASIHGSSGSGLPLRSGAARSNPGRDPTAKARLMEEFGKLPLRFEVNTGQTDSRVNYLSRGPGYTLFLTGDEAVLALRGASQKSNLESRQLARATDHGRQTTDSALRLKLVGANPAAKVTGLDELPGKSNYFIGKDPKKWRTNVPNYARVKYENVYPGIDLVYYGGQLERSEGPGGSGGQLEYDFVVAAGADPSAISLALEGADDVTVDDGDDLDVDLGQGVVVRFERPRVYQIVRGVRKDLDGRYVLKTRVGRHGSPRHPPEFLLAFSVPSYDPTQPLIIDPVLSYSTYLGGSSYDYARGIAVDGSGNAYVTGYTYSSDFPLQNPLPTPNNALQGYSDVFVAKIDTTKTYSTLIYSTYLGGSDDDSGYGIAVDSSGNAYITGSTLSGNFPWTTGAFQTMADAGVCSVGPCAGDAFVTKLNASGNVLDYSTFLGGSGSEGGAGIAVDASGKVYVTGYTSSFDFPTNNAYQSGQGGSGGFAAFVAMFDLTQTGSASLVYSSYFGGYGAEGSAIAVDTAGIAYVTGDNGNGIFPTTPGSYQPNSNGGVEAFVMKVDPSQAGTPSLIYSTFLGGSADEYGMGIAADALGNAYLTGYTSSTDFPLANPFQSGFGLTVGGYFDAFVARIDTTQAGSASLIYSTYLGGSGDDYGYGIAVDASGNAYVTGGTTSSDFPAVPGAIQTTLAGGLCEVTCPDAFVTELNAAGSALAFSTYLGGQSEDYGTGIAVDSSGNIYVTGYTGASDFPTTSGARQQTAPGGGDAFLVKISPADASLLVFTPNYLNFANQVVGTTSAPVTVTAHNMGSAPLNILNVGITGDFAQTNTCGSSIPGGGACTIDVTFTPTVGAWRDGELWVTDTSGRRYWFGLDGLGYFTGGHLGFTATTVDFGNQVVGTTSGPRMLTLTNNGSVAVTIVSIVSDNVSEFAVTSDCPLQMYEQSLAVGATCNVTATFAPSAVGTRTGSILITDDTLLSPETIALKGTGIASSGPTTCPTPLARLNENYGKTPLMFAANRGQTDPQVKFISRGRGYSLFLTPTEAVLSLDKTEGLRSKIETRKSKVETRNPEREGTDLSLVTRHSSLSSGTPAVVRMQLLGANPAAQVAGVEELPGKSNYFLGKDPEKWRSNVPNYARVRYAQVYPGIDLVYYGKQRKLEYDFIVAPGADPKAIALAIETGSSKLEKPVLSEAKDRNSKIVVDQNGDLVVNLEGGEVRFHKPVVYQTKSTVDSRQLTVVRGQTADNRQSSIVNRQFLEGHYVLLAGNRIGFEVGSYDHTQPLIIDPILSYSTYLGGSDWDSPYGIAVDSACYAYVTGYTASLDFPTTSGALQTALPVPGWVYDAFVTKLSPDGSSLIYSTYLGGAYNDDLGTGIAVDSSGNAYVRGQTCNWWPEGWPYDFPTTSGAFQTTMQGYCNVFVSKLDPTGARLVYSTLLGGSAYEDYWWYPTGIAVDSSGNAYVAGQTASSDFPTTPGAFQTTFTGSSAAFVTKFNPTGTALVYSTFLGGGAGGAIAVDSSENAYVVGAINSTGFPATPGAFQTSFAGGTCGNPPNTYPCQDLFVAKLNPTGTALVYGTYLGGSKDDWAYGPDIAVDSAGNAYVGGDTDSADFPTTPGAFQPTSKGGTCSYTSYGVVHEHPCSDAFVTKLNAAGSALVYSTYVGGSSEDNGNGFAVDSLGNAYLSGNTLSTDFPVTPGAVQAAFAGQGSCGTPGYTYDCEDTFLIKLNSSGSALIYATYLGGTSDDWPAAVAVDPSGNAYVTGYTISSDFPTTAGAFQPTANGSICYGGYYPQPCGDAFVTKLSDMALPVTMLSATSLTFADQMVGLASAAETITLTNGGDAPLTISSITPSGDFAVTDTCGGSVAAGANCAIDITFTPTLTGSRTGTVTIVDSAATSPHVVNLSGNGTPALTTTVVSAPTVTYNSDAVVTVTVTSSAGTVTGDLSLTVDGGSPLTQTLSTGSTTFTLSTPTAGSHALSASYAAQGNFAASSASGTLQVNKAIPTLTWTNPAAITYGTALSSVQLNAAASFNASPLAGTFTFTPPPGTVLNAGPSQILSVTFTPADTTNFDATTASVLITVNQAPLTITASNASRTYGAANPTFTATYSGFVNGETSSVLTGTLTCTSPATPTSPVSGSPYAITCSGQSSTNYAITYVAGQLTVTPAPLMITASNASRTYGAANPTFTATSSGFVNGETSSVLTGTLTCSSPATPTSPVSGSPYAITCSGQTSTDYAITYVAGQLTVTVATPTFSSLTPSQTIAFGMASITLAGNIAAGSAYPPTSEGVMVTINSVSQTAAIGSSGAFSASFDTHAIPASFTTYTITYSYPGDANFASASDTSTTLAVVAPAVSLSATSLTFASRLAGTTSGSKTITLTNVGTALMTISNIGVTGNFAETHDCTAFLGVGLSCNINVTFTPTAMGTLTGQLSITDDAPGSPQTVGLTGTGFGNPVPFVSQPLVPAAVAPGGPDFALTVNGTGFASGAVVKWNGSALATNFVNSGQLTATVPAANMAVAGTASVTVFNPAPGGGASNVVSFQVTGATPSIWLNKSGFPTGGGPGWMTAGDFNGDGQLDLAVPNNGVGTVSVLLGNGDGTLQAKVDYVTAAQPFSATLGDFNSDGRLDLATANRYGNGVSILLGNGDGTFQSHVDYAAGADPQSVVAGDFNGDGKLDVAVANGSGRSVSILRGNGDGSFQTNVDYATSSSPLSVTLGDFNGDGKLDLATANAGGTVSILLGIGDGTFQPSVGYAAGGQPRWIISGDFNGDGKLDLAAVNETSSTVSILLGNGDGTLQSQSVYTTGSSPESVATGDFNGDGKLDLATANVGSNTVSILLGNGDGSFQNPLEFTAGLTSRSVVTADFNGDGRLDLATANSGDSTVSILLQQPAVFLSPISLEFGNQLVGGTSPAQVVTLTNTGTAALGITGIATSGDFTQSNTCGASVAAGASCTLTVTFKPTVTGPLSGAVTISDDAQGSPHAISLAGTGIQQGISISPGSISFTDQLVGTTSGAQVVTVGNNGTAPLNIASVTVTSGFTQTSTCVGALAPAATCTIAVTFSSTAAGVLTGTLTLTSDAPGSPHSVGLSGKGVAPAVSLSTTSVNFPGNPLDLDCPTRDVILTNTGDGILEITSIVPTGEFIHATTCGPTLDPGASCVISIKFSPTQEGTANETLTITHSAAGSPHIVLCTGTGTPPCGLVAAVRTTTVVRGTDSAEFTIADKKPSCSPAPIDLTCSVDGPARCAFTVNRIPPSGSTTLQVSNLRSATSGPLNIVVSGRSEFRTSALALTVLVSDFTMTNYPVSASVEAGHTATYSLTLSPTNGLRGNIQLACQGAPAGATCSVSPERITLDGITPLQANVTVTTTARSRGMFRPGLPAAPNARYGIPTLLLLATLLALLASRRRRAASALAAVLLMAVLWAACGGGGGYGSRTATTGTPPGTYTLTVSATYTGSSAPGSATLSHVTQLRLKVD